MLCLISHIVLHICIQAHVMNTWSLIKVRLKQNHINMYVIVHVGCSKAVVLNLWAAAHWCAAGLCLVGRDQGWELRIFLWVTCHNL